MLLFKCDNQILRQILIFYDFHVFFRKIRHNRHIFRQFGRKFFNRRKIILQYMESISQWSRSRLQAMCINVGDMTK